MITLWVPVNWGRSVSGGNVHCVLSEGFAVQRREPAGQRDALWGAQTQECTEDHAESCVPLSRYTLRNTPVSHCCKENGSWGDGALCSGPEPSRWKDNCKCTDLPSVLALLSDDAGTWAGLMAACHTENTSCYLSGSAPRRQGLEQTLMAVVSEKGANNRLSLFGCCFVVCLSVELKNSVCPSARGEAGDRAPAGPGTGGLDTTAGSDWPHGRRKAGAGRSSLHTGENAILMPVSEYSSATFNVFL